KEDRLEFLDDLAVPADRTVQLLQVAVDHPGEVVEFFPRGQSDGSQRLRPAHLALPAGPPGALFECVFDAAIVQIAVEPRLVNRVDRADAHGNGRKLPEMWHQPGVRIRGEPLGRSAGVLLSEGVPLVGGEPSFEVRPSIDTGRRVALDEDVVTAAGMILAAEEVVEADLVQARIPLVGRDVSADLKPLAVGFADHDRRIPADEGTNPALDVLVARKPWLEFRWNRIDVIAAA